MGGRPTWLQYLLWPAVRWNPRTRSNYRANASRKASVARWYCHEIEWSSGRHCASFALGVRYRAPPRTRVEKKPIYRAAKAMGRGEEIF